MDFCPRRTGPYKIVKKISDIVYKVRRPYGRKDVTLHHDRYNHMCNVTFVLEILEQM